ncbi:MAG TPA: aldolase/citrate lyase family protein, partial [Pirellulales bacterium]|nr:aldolase/citrate lyase family protein [Pirellulales bacterium]
MRSSRVKQKLRRNEPVLVTCLHLTDPSVFELASLMGFDAIWMDMEHHSYSLETAANLMRAARVGVADILVRPAKGEFMRMDRMLEAGAQGIMYPRCSNAAEAAEVVRWAKFAPQGTRGFDGGNADMPYCTMGVADYIRQANAETFIVIQLEDEGAVHAADEIAAIEGVDALMFGPADFSILSGIPGEFDHPRIQEAIRHVAQAARRQGKHWGTPSSSVEHCQRLMELGARMHYHMADIVAVRNALQAVQKQFTP